MFIFQFISNIYVYSWASREGSKGVYLHPPVDLKIKEYNLKMWDRGYYIIIIEFSGHYFVAVENTKINLYCYII
jgi:hypothetical protein